MFPVMYKWIPSHVYVSVMESVSRNREFSPDDAIQNCLAFPELVRDLTLEERKEALVLAEAMICETYDPHLKDQYRRLIQGLKTANAAFVASQGVASVYTDYGAFLVDVDGAPVLMKPILNYERDIHHPALLSLPEVQRDDIDADQSGRFIFYVSDPEHRFWINLVMFLMTQKNGDHKRIMYIADWYVAPSLRGRGVGAQLHKIAQKISLTDGCSMIFGILRPDDPEDMPDFQDIAMEEGFRIHSTEEDASVVIKRFS